MSDYSIEPTEDMEDEELEEGEESVEESEPTEVESKKTVFENLKHDYNKAKEAKVQIDKMIAESNDLYDALSTKDGDDQGSAFTMKEVAKFIEWQKPNVTEPFTKSSRPIKVSSENETMARIASKYLNKEFTRTFGRQKFIEDIADVLSREGTVWVRTSWTYKEAKRKERLKGIYPEEALELEKISNIEVNEDGTIDVDHEYVEMIKNSPNAEVCRNEHIFPDPSARTEDEMQFLCYRREMTISQLRETGLYNEKKLKHLESRIETKHEDTHLGVDRDAKARQYGYDISYQAKDVARQKVDIIEYWGYYDLDGDGIAEPIIATWADKFNCDLRLEENPFPQKNIPFHRQVYSSRPYSLWGNSLSFFIGDIQRIKSGAMRGILDNMSLANNAQKFVERGTLDYVNFKRMTNGARHVVVNKKDGIQDGSYNVIPNSVFSVIQMMDSEGKQLSGLDNDGAMNSANGNKADGDFVPTTTSQQRMSDTVMKMSTLLNGVMQDWLDMARMFLEDSQIESLFTDQEEAFLTALEGEFEVSVVTGTSSNKMNQIKELNMLMQQTGDDIELKKIISAEMFDLFDKPELADRIRMSPPPQPSQAQVQMEQMQLQEQMLKNQLLQVQIQKTAMDGQSGAIKARASMEGATNGRISATSKSRVDGAKAQEVSVSTALKPVEALANLNKGNANGSRPTGI